MTNAAGSDEEVKADYITVNPRGNPTAAFTASATRARRLTVLHDESTGSTLNYAWDFDNNGVVDSTEQTEL